MQTYENDVNAWANEQALLLRTGRFDLLDVEHIAAELEDVGKSEQRELARCLASLLAQLLKWKFQPERRAASWEKVISAQRTQISYILHESPSLALKLREPRLLDVVWAHAIAQAVSETGLEGFPGECPWAIQDEVLSESWMPK